MKADEANIRKSGGLLLCEQQAKSNLPVDLMSIHLHSTGTTTSDGKSNIRNIANNSSGGSHFKLHPQVERRSTERTKVLRGLLQVEVHIYLVY
jgi:hypothetical protein